MKFAIPRTASPSPERVVVHPQHKPLRSGYGLRDADLYNFDDDSDDDYLPSPPEPESDSASDNDYHPNPYNLPRSREQQRQLDLAVAALKRQAKYVDPFRQWQKDARTEAQREGESRHQQLLSRLEQERLKRLDEEKKQRAAAQQRQLDEMQMMLQNVRLEREREMESLRRDFQVRDKKLWEDIDRVIADEERKAAEKKREEERRRKEEQERLEGEEKARKEAEEKRLQEEKEKKLQEELQRQKEAKDAQEKKEREEAEIAVAAEKQKQLEALGQMSAQLGVLSPELEWEAGWKTLERIKKEIHSGIKADRSLKDARNRLRRQIVPKIGQLTADAQQIDRVTAGLMEIMKPTTPHPQIIYEALLSSLAKAFVVQAETEITAREASALPLARVLVQLLAELPGLGEVLFARLVQRIGFWAIPFVAPMPSTMSKEEKDKIKGIQQGDENGEARATRIGGVMVLIFCVMHTPHPKPLPEMFRLGRFWTYVARLLSSKTLCKSNIALAILRAALAVAGDQAVRVWGKQWLKILSVILKRVDDAAPANILIGTQGVEGTARRIRVREEIRKLQ